MFHCCTFSTDNGHNYRTVLWPLGAMSRCVSYKYFLPTDVSFLDNCLHAFNTSWSLVRVYLSLYSVTKMHYTAAHHFLNTASVCLSPRTAGHCIHN